MTYPTYGSPLLAHVQKLVQERPATITLRVLAAEAGVSKNWLSGFACGQMPGARATVIEFLYRRLSGKELIVTNVPEHSA